MSDFFSRSGNVFGLDENFLAPRAPTDYTQGASVKTLEDPRFHRDLRDYYAARGISGTTDELIERWKSDERYNSANIMFAGFAAGRTALASEEQNAREARLAAVWNAQPNFWEEGGAGWVDALVDYVPAAIIDPTNLFTLGKAGAVGLRAASIAGAKGQNALLAGVSRGALEGAKWEGAFNAGVGGVQSLLEQQREVNLGMTDGLSLARTATDAAVGGVIGGAAGGIMGGVLGGVASRNAPDALRQLEDLGYSRADVGGMRPEQFDQALAQGIENPVAVQAREQAAADQAAAQAAAARQAEADRQALVERARTEMGPQNLSAEEIIAAQRAQLERDYVAARARTLAETNAARRERKIAIEEDLQAQLVTLDQLATAPARISALSERAQSLASKIGGNAEADATAMARAQELQRAAISLQADYRILTRGTPTDQVPTFLNRLAELEETFLANPAAARAPGTLAPNPTITTTPAATQAAAPAAAPPAQASTPAATPVAAQTPTAQPASPGAQVQTPARQGQAAAQPEVQPAAPTPQAQVAQFLRANPQTTVAKITKGTGLDQAVVRQELKRAGTSITTQGNKVTVTNADALPQPEPTPAAPQQPAPAAAQPAAPSPAPSAAPTAAAPAPDPVFARVRDWANTQTEVTPERVTASLPDVTPAQARSYLDQLVTEGALSAPTSNGVYASRTSPPPKPEVTKVSKPARRRANELKVPVDALPPNAKVEDVERVAKELGPQVAPQFSADQQLLDEVLSEYAQLIPPQIIEEMNLFDDPVFMEKLLRADPRTAPRFDALNALYLSTRENAELEMRLPNGARLSAEDVETLMASRVDQLVELQMQRTPDADRAEVQRIISETMLARQAGDTVDPDRAAPSPAAAEIADRRRMTRAGGPGVDAVTAGRDPSTGRIQSIIKFGRDLSETAGSIVQTSGRQESPALSRARMPTYIQAPRQGQFAYEEALLQAQASVERAASHNKSLDRRIEQLARSAAEAAARAASDEDRAAAGARRDETVQRLRQQVKDLKSSGRANIASELRTLEERIANELNAPDPIYIRVYNDTMANPRPALERWATNQAKRDVAEITARNKDTAKPVTPERAEQLMAEKEAYYRRQIEPQAGVDVAAFVATGSDDVRFAGGRVRPTKGQVGYIDALSGKVYPDLQSLYLRRGMSPEDASRMAERSVGLQPSVVADPRLAPTTVSDPFQPIREAIIKFKADGDLRRLRTVLEKYADPATLRRDAPSTSSAKYPGLKDGQVVALVPLDGSEARVMSFNAAKTSTAEDLLDAGEKIEDFEVVYLPPKQALGERQSAINAARARIVEQGREREAAGDAAGAARAADPAVIVPPPQTMSVETFGPMRVAVPDSERAGVIEALVEMRGLSRADAEARLSELTGEELLEMVDGYEMMGLVARDARGRVVEPKPGSSRGWPKTVASYERRFAIVKALNSTIAVHAPAGLARAAIPRAESLKAVRQVLSTLPAARVKVIERIFSSFINRDGGAPLIGRASSETGGASYSPLTNTVKLPSGANFDVLMPGELKTLHELAHWAYFNILTPNDRIEFWGTLRKFYGPDGNLDEQALNRFAVPGVTNARLNPQEYLANSFVAFASGRLVPEVTEQSFWSRVTGYMQAVFDWFIKKKPIDPDLVPIFSKMLPEPERIQNAAADISAAVEAPQPAPGWRTVAPTARTSAPQDAPSAAVKPVEPYDPANAIQSAKTNLGLVNDLKDRWERAIDSGNYDALINAANETSSWLMAAKDMFFVRRKPAGDERGFDWGKFYISRSRDIQSILNQKGPAAPDFDVTQGERATASSIDGRVRDPKRVFEQLRQLYRTGHNIPADQQLRAQRGEEAVFVGGFAGKERTSMTWLFNQATNDINAYIARFDGKTPASVPDAVRPGKTPDPEASEIAAKAVDATVDRKAAEKAADLVATGEKGRSRKGKGAKASIAQIGGQSIEGMSLDQLRDLYARVRDTEGAAAIEAQVQLLMRSGDPEVLRKPVANMGEAFDAIARLSKTQLLSTYSEAIEQGDIPAANLAAYEIARRRVKKEGSSSKIQKAAATELQMRIGMPSQPGIPASAPATLQDFLARMTHRTPVDEATTRTLALRLAIVGRGEGPLTRGDISRISGQDIDGAAFNELVDFDGDEFRSLRNQLRRMASALDTDGTTPAPQVVDQVASLAIRAVDVDNRLAQEANLSTLIAEHFRHNLSRRALAEQLSDPSLITKVDEAIDTARHLTSGLVGRADVRAEYPGLVVGSDFLAADPAPIASRFRSDAVPASIVNDYVEELRKVGGETYQTNVKSFTGAGIGDGRVFYRLPDGSLVESPTPAAAPRMGQVTTQLMNELILQEDAAASALRAALLEGDMSTVAAASERIAAIRDLSREGNGPNTTVAPVYLKARAVAHFDDRAVYRSTDALVKSIVRDLVGSGRVPKLEAENMLASIPADGVTGSQLWSMISDVAGDGAAVATLRDLGYDGFTAPSGRMTIFDPTAIRPVDDNSFNTPLIPVGADMRGILGDTMATAIMTDEVPRSMAPIADELELRIGGPNVITRAIAAIGANKNPTQTQALEVQRAGIYTMTFAANSDRLRRAGGRHWLADFAESHFRKFNDDLGKRLFDTKTGLLTRLHSLDKANPIKRWARKASPFFTLGKTAPTQPESHFRIVAALRQPSGSMHEKALKPEEKAVYREIRLAMQEEFRRLRDAGVQVNNFGPDYFPQVWSAEQITNDSKQFLDAMKQYYRIESEYYGREFDEATANQFAENMYLTMSDQGVDGHMVERSGHSFSSSADHIDHARLINLQLPGVGRLLEPFLETDLEAVVVKYFDASTRRRLFTEQFGNNAHGFRDYQSIAIGGREPIIKMLMTNKVMRRTTRRFDTDAKAVVEDEVARLEYEAPFKDRPDLAAQFADRIITMNDPVAAREELFDLVRNRDGSVPQAWKRRAEAISAALADFKGEPARLHADEHTFEEQLMRVMMRKPLGSNQFAIDSSRFIRNFNSVTLLGFTMLSSFGDLILPLVRSGEFRATQKAWTKFATDPSYRRLMEGTGVAMESILNERLTHLYGAGAGRFTNAFFWLNGLTPWTNTMRKMGAAVGHQTFIAMQDKALRYHMPNRSIDQQHPQFKLAYRFLKRYGLEEFATSSNSLEAEALLREDTRLRMAINQFADEAVFSPNPNDVPLWAQTPVGAMIFQLKSFPLMMQRLAKTVLVDDVVQAARAAKEDGIQGLVANAPKRALAFLAVAPAFGAASLAAADIARGRGGEENREHELRTRNLAQSLGAPGNQAGDESDFWGWYVESLMMVGGLGLLGDMLHKTAQNIDNGAFGYQRTLSAVFGPTVGTTQSAFNFLAGTADAITGANESNAPERTAMREVLMRLPIAGGIVGQREALIDNTIGEPNTD